jgi:hypothetical protein
MNDLLLKDNDLVILGSGELGMVKDSDAVWQQIEVALGLWQGDYYYNQSQGVPYRTFFENLKDLLTIQGFFLSYFYQYNIIRILDLMARVQDGVLYLEGTLTDTYGVTKTLRGPMNGQ